MGLWQPSANAEPAGIDYGVGPNALVASLPDISTWPAGQHGCTYYNGSTSQYTGDSRTATSPVLASTGNSNTAYTISGYNFGPTAYQGSPSGTHDCVSLWFQQPGTDLETVTVSGNAFINGAACIAQSGRVDCGIVSLYYN
jgi:hypothetical protein